MNIALPVVQGTIAVEADHLTSVVEEASGCSEVLEGIWMMALV